MHITIDLRPKNPGPPPVKRPGYPPMEEQILYYRAVMGEKWVPEGMTSFQTSCPFKPNLNHRFMVYLEAARWNCMQCGEGDIFGFQAKLSEREHIRASIARVWDMIADVKAGKAKKSGPTAAADDKAPPAEPTTIERQDVRRLFGLVCRHPGSTRRYLQQCLHAPAGRFDRALRRLELQGRVTWREEFRPGGRRLPVYFPVLG